MAAVSEWIAREYFESLGFMVHQPNKYQVAARSKRADEEFELLISNPKVAESPIPNHTVWGSNDIAKVHRAIVGVRGWHTDRFTPGVLDSSPEIFRIANPEVIEEAHRIFGEGPMATILCIPGLPISKEMEQEASAILKSRGIDGVLPFRTMLLELTRFVDVNKNYDKSDLLQVLRLMKNYDLLKDPQLDFFHAPGKKKGRVGRVGSEGGGKSDE